MTQIFPLTRCECCGRAGKQLRRWNEKDVCLKCIGELTNQSTFEER